MREICGSALDRAIRSAFLGLTASQTAMSDVTHQKNQNKIADTVDEFERRGVPLNPQPSHAPAAAPTVAQTLIRDVDHHSTGWYNSAEAQTPTAETAGACPLSDDKFPSGARHAGS